MNDWNGRVWFCKSEVAKLTEKKVIAVRKRMAPTHRVLFTRKSECE